jgi:hypothetical protein
MGVFSGDQTVRLFGHIKSRWVIWERLIPLPDSGQRSLNVLDVPFEPRMFR